jgi:hypothetical protein
MPRRAVWIGFGLVAAGIGAYAILIIAANIGVDVPLPHWLVGLISH